MRIAISGRSGCGNTTVSAIVARRLGISLINYTFRMMAEERNMSFQELRALAEKDDSVDMDLDRRQVELAMESDCVLASRLAIWMLEEADLKVYLDATAEERARRIASREGGSVEQKLEETLRRDELDTKRYARIYGIDNTDTSRADLVIDTSRYTPDEIASQIIAAVSTVH